MTYVPPEMNTRVIILDVFLAIDRIEKIKTRCDGKRNGELSLFLSSRNDAIVCGVYNLQSPRLQPRHQFS